MTNLSNMDPVTLTADFLSRETTLAEGHTEDTPTATDDQHQSPPHPSEPDADDATDNGHLPQHSHPSEPGVHKPPGAAGYAHLAEFMNVTQHGMVRKYKDLSLLNLLYLQAEIHQLRTEWDAEVEADARATGEDNERRLWDYHWGAMATASERGLEGRRWEVWGRLRRRLYEYYDAIQKHDRICALPTPSNAQRSFISEYMASNDLNGRRGAFFSAELRGEQPSAYRERWLEDLTVFEHGPEMHDAFGRWVVMPVLKAAHFLYLGRRKKPLNIDLEIGSLSPSPSNSNNNEKSPPNTDADSSVTPLYQYNAAGYTTLNRTLNAIMIILVPCAAIVSLNAVPDTNKRVGMVCAFSLLCAVGMAICSGARRIEVFAVSAAFMSVQLVFVGQQGGPGS